MKNKQIVHIPVKVEAVLEKEFIKSLQPKTDWGIEISEQIEDNKIKIIKIL